MPFIFVCYHHFCYHYPATVTVSRFVYMLSVLVVAVCCYSSKEVTFKTYIFLLFFVICDVPVFCFNPSFLWETWCNSAFFVFPTSSLYQWDLYVLLQRLFPNVDLQIGLLQVLHYATFIWDQIYAWLRFLFQMHSTYGLCYGFFLLSSIHYRLKKGHGFLQTVSLLSDLPKSARRSSLPSLIVFLSGLTMPTFAG